MCNSVSSYSDRTDMAGPTGNRPRGHPSLSVDELSGWDCAKRRVRIRMRIAIRCTARGGRIAVAMAVSRDFRVIPARYSRVVVPTPVLDQESSERIYDGVIHVGVFRQDSQDTSPPPYRRLDFRNVP